MRPLLAALALSLSLGFIVADTAEAARRKTTSQLAEAARAHDADPSGTYAAYPDWARIALGRGGRGWR